MANLIETSSLIHQTDSLYSYPTSLHGCLISLLTKKGDPGLKAVRLIYQGKYRGEKSRKRVEMPLAYSDTLHDHYEVRLSLQDVRILYLFELEDVNGDVIYFSEAGVSNTYDMGQTCYNAFQLSYIAGADLIKTNERFSDRIFYQIFPDRFCRDESVPSSHPLIKWGEAVDLFSFAGGNIKGIISKIPYLKDLGVGALYLNPLWKGMTNHKYDTLSYGEVDPDFGTDEDLIELVEVCHQNDILIVLDLVYNHMSYLNPIFQDVVNKGRDSKYYDWFLIDGDYPEFKKGNYESFGIHPYMPRINLSNKEASDHFIEVSLSIVKKYHVDGFRLDVGDEVPHAFWRKHYLALKELDPDFLIIGENWHHSESFLNQGEQWDSVMNYALTRFCRDYFIRKEYGAEKAVEELYGIWGRYKETINHNLLNLISSHDKIRFLNEADFDKDIFLSAYAFIFLFPGLPSLYYGDEVGLKGGDDPDCRRCFPKESEFDLELLKAFKELIKIRNSFKLSKAEMRISSKSGLLNLTYTLEGKTLKAVFNASKENLPLKEKGLVYSHNYDGETLGSNGFAIFEG